jgi:Universal stress protein family
MFSKIVVALNDLPESQRALRTAVELVRTSNAELATVSILGDLGDLPSYTSLAIVVSGVPFMTSPCSGPGVH